MDKLSPAEKAQPAKSQKKKLELVEIEKNMQKTWEEEKPYESNAVENPTISFEEKNRQKYFMTFPYPYMNGSLHVGHAFSLSKNDFQNRFQHLKGKNTLWPFSFHCTGMPIPACAKILKDEIDFKFPKRKEIFSEKQKKIKELEESKADQKTIISNYQKLVNEHNLSKKQRKDLEIKQFYILRDMGISENDIPLFTDPKKWIAFFPKIAQDDLKSLGVSVDWRRSFITTEMNPFYDSFIRWQFTKLKEKGLIDFGDRYVVYSPLDHQPCADHDRSSGEGFNPQEYTLIKIQVLEPFPPELEKCKGTPLFLVAATLRPETMYGQTNCYILPSGKYGVFKMKNGELFICSDRSALNMAYQKMTTKFGEVEKILEISGMDLLGLPLKAPLTSYEKVYSLPMFNISMSKGTGVVTSVPSDAPDDWAALKDLQKKKELRDKFKITEEMVKYDPIPIIHTSFGDLTAVTLYDEMKIQSQNDREKLAAAKDKSYLQGFTEGILKVGEFAGEKVNVAKNKVKQLMIEKNLACTYYEPEDLVIARSGCECVVAICPQWLIKYGENEWKNKVMNYVNSEAFNTFSDISKKMFIDTLNWLKEWAISRTFGMGTKVPWDEKFLIESLSDSTIYMAYYTISHLTQGIDNIYGTKLGPLGIKPEDMTHEVWDYIFLGLGNPKCNISEDKLKLMRKEFEYWYPMDLRCSAKDLIKNHLTFSLYNHKAIWGDDKYMPRSFFLNGYILLDGEKMSKHLGNFLTLKDCVEKFGADATRVALADSGDTMEDGNFVQTTPNAAILRIHSISEWICEALSLMNKDNFGKQEMNFFDIAFENEMNKLIGLTIHAFEQFRYRDVLKYGFYDFENIKNEYVITKGGINNINYCLILKFIENYLLLMHPIIPHFTDFCWRFKFVSKLSELGIEVKYPNLTRARFNDNQSYKTSIGDSWNYLRYIKELIKSTYEKATAMKKGKKPAKEEKGPITYDKCNILIAKEYNKIQKMAIEFLSSIGLDEHNIIKNQKYAQILKSKFEKKDVEYGMKFAKYIVDEAKLKGPSVFNLQLSFNEKEVLSQNVVFIMQGMKFTHIEFKEVEEGALNSKDEAKSATPGRPVILFFN